MEGPRILDGLDTFSPPFFFFVCVCEYASRKIVFGIHRTREIARDPDFGQCNQQTGDVLLSVPKLSNLSLRCCSLCDPVSLENLS